MNQLYFIYALLESGSVFYVGASQNLPRRRIEHRKKFGNTFDIEILEECSPMEWRDREHHWIQYYRDIGVKLRNKTAGGNGGEKLSDETRAKLSAAKKGVAKPKGFGEKVSKAQKGQPRIWTPEGHARVRANQFRPGQKTSGAGWRDLKNWTPEKRSAAASKANATRWKKLTGEDRQRICANMSAAQKATDSETRARMSAISAECAKRQWSGVPKSPEQRAKMAEARRIWWARKRAQELAQA